ncbi:MAG TPA: ArsR family transcriptional regulator [Euryarchaeota archaeon]|nr:bacterial regulatory protein, arsR family [archaeon BMS3Bbin15]HDL15218.1 ArsR family transcriptional regulator [Euryarchaeota archaeon]
MEMEILLNLLGNVTRRGILNILAERPCYVSEISQVLNIGQKAVIEHLELMRKAGILNSNYEKIEKGRPRKYYNISEDIILEVKISPDYFYIETFLPEEEEGVEDISPQFENLIKKFREISQLEGWDKIKELKGIHDELKKEQERLSRAKRVVEYLQREVRNEIKRESLIDELNELIY